MSDTHVEGDTRYLFKRDKTWWVKVAVPRTLRDELGYDLRRSLHTHDLDAARESRWDVIEEFRSEIEKVKAGKDGDDNGDSHKNAEVRRGLQPLVDLATVVRCVVLGIDLSIQYV